jgi:calnexin
MKHLQGLLLMAAALQSAAELLFSETFDSDPFASGKWILSTKDKYQGQPVKVMPSTTASPEFASDNGVQLTQEMRHYGFGSVFNSPISFTGDDLAIQYEVKLDETLNCGGAYIKLLRDTTDLSNLDNSSPYSIMFGPDKCGATNKIHFILQYQNPVTKEYEEKHFNESIPMRGDKNTHLYTLVLHKDEENSFEILIDNKQAKKGSLLTHMIPAINPPEMIDDPADFKPSDWVDEATMPDPDAVKPEDWNEEAPRRIPDPAATRPALWDEAAPLQIPDPNAVKPQDWDDEEDGEWEAPLVDNPQCHEKDGGCGPWSPPLIPNPDYKGKWTAPLIANPAYKGPWKPRQVPNPGHFFEGSPVTRLAPMTAVAVEVWTVNGGIHLDNFAIGSAKDVKAFAEVTFENKKAAEKRAGQKEEKSRKSAERQKAIDSSASFTEKAKAYLLLAVDYLQDNPIALFFSVAAALVPILALVFYGSSSSAGATSSAHQAHQASATSSGSGSGSGSADGDEDDDKDDAAEAKEQGHGKDTNTNADADE